jgi:hypothetical protein
MTKTVSFASLCRQHTSNNKTAAHLKNHGTQSGCSLACTKLIAAVAIICATPMQSPRHYVTLHAAKSKRLNATKLVIMVQSCLSRGQVIDLNHFMMVVLAIASLVSTHCDRNTVADSIGDAPCNI